MSYLFIYFDLNSRLLCCVNKYKKGQILKDLRDKTIVKKILQFTSTCAFAVVSQTINCDCF